MILPAVILLRRLLNPLPKLRFRFPIQLILLDSIN
jgi:hypothetical protein